MRIVVADDNLLIREGVRALLEGAPGIELVGICHDRDSLLASIETDRPDVVLTDVRMPPSQRDEGIVIANELRHTHPEMGVIVLSQYEAPGYVVALLAAGSARRGYLLKDRLSDRAQLIKAIEEVAAGGSVIDPKVVEALVAAQRGKDRSLLDVLTPRESEILAEVAAGKSEHGDRRNARDHQAGGRAPRQLDLREARAARRVRGQPAGDRGADVPGRGRDISLLRDTKPLGTSLSVRRGRGPIRHPSLDGRALAGPGIDHDCSIERTHPVAHVRKPGSLS